MSLELTHTLSQCLSVAEPALGLEGDRPGGEVQTHSQGQKGKSSSVTFEGGSVFSF